MGKTVTTYLIDGDPKGTQYAFISNKICQMFVVPRSNLSYLNTQEKLQKPAFYILLGEDENTKPQASIGESEKVGLKLNIQKNKIMASGPITSWQIDEETVSDFILGGLQNRCRW